MILFIAMTTKITKSLIKSFRTKKMFFKGKIIRTKIKLALIETNQN